MCFYTRVQCITYLASLTLSDLKCVSIQEFYASLTLSDLKCVSIHEFNASLTLSDLKCVSMLDSMHHLP